MTVNALSLVSVTAHPVDTTIGTQFGGVPVCPTGQMSGTQFGGVPVCPAGQSPTGTQLGGLPAVPSGQSGSGSSSSRMLTVAAAVAMLNPEALDSRTSNASVPSSSVSSIVGTLTCRVCGLAENVRVPDAAV